MEDISFFIKVNEDADFDVRSIPNYLLDECISKLLGCVSKILTDESFTGYELSKYLKFKSCTDYINDNDELPVYISIYTTIDENSSNWPEDETLEDLVSDYKLDVKELVTKQFESFSYRENLDACLIEVYCER